MQKRLPLFFSLRRALKQRAHRGLDVKRAFDQPLDTIGDWHVDAALARQLGQRERGEPAFGQALPSRFGDASSASERLTESEVARMRR